MHARGPGLRDADDAREVVEWYFGDVTAEVAAEAPVSRERLLVALGRLHLAAVRRPLRPPGRVAHRGPTEVVVLVPETTWDLLASAGEVDTLPLLAARETHRRMAVALGVRNHERRQPLVLAREHRPDG